MNQALGPPGPRHIEVEPVMGSTARTQKRTALPSATPSASGGCSRPGELEDLLGDLLGNYLGFLGFTVGLPDFLGNYQGILALLLGENYFGFLRIYCWVNCWLYCSSLVLGFTWTRLGFTVGFLRVRWG